MEERKPNISNESQELYDIFVSQGTKLAAKASDALRGQQPNTPGIVGTIGDAVVDIVNKVEDEGKSHGIKFDEVALVHGTTEIIQNLINMSQIKLSDEQKKQIAGHVVGRYINEAVKSGKMTQQQVAEIGNGFKKMEGGKNGV